MRVTLIANPVASRGSRQISDRVAMTLSKVCNLDLKETTARHHARKLAEAAVKDGTDLIVVLGGDGTLHQAAQGLASATAGQIHDRPALAIIPAGGADVFAQLHGIPTDPQETANMLAQTILRDRQLCDIPVGEVKTDSSEYVFLFNGGIGLDADVVSRVEESPELRRRLNQWLFVIEAARRFFTYRYRRPRLTISTPEYSLIGRFLIFGLYESYTYFGDRPLRIFPGANPIQGVTAFAMRRMSVPVALLALARGFGSTLKTNLPGIEIMPNQARIRIEADRPLPIQLDGESLPPASKLEVVYQPRTLPFLFPTQTTKV